MEMNPKHIARAFESGAPDRTLVRLFRGLGCIEGPAGRHQLSLERHEKKNCENVPPNSSD